MIDPFVYSSKNVVIGRDSFLFLFNGGHHVHSYHTGLLVPSTESIDSFQSNIRRRAEYCESRSIAYHHLMFPNKQSSLADYYPSKIKSVSDFYLSGLDRHDLLIDMSSALVDFGADVWLKTDTHLNRRGEILSSLIIASKIAGVDFSNHGPQLMRAPFSRSRRGDLSHMLGEDGNEMIEEETLFGAHWIRHQFNNSMAGGNNGLIDIYISPSAILDRRVLMFGDSFGRGCASCLSYFFSHVLFCRTPFMHPEIIEAYCPQIVISQSIERYLPSTVPDDLRPLFLLYPMIGKHWKAHEGDQIFFSALNAELSFPRSPYTSFMEGLVSM